MGMRKRHAKCRCGVYSGLASSPAAGRLPRLRLNTLPDPPGAAERRGAPGHQAPRAALPPLTPDSAQRQAQRAQQRWAGLNAEQQQPTGRAASLRDWHANLDALRAAHFGAAAAAAAASAPQVRSIIASAPRVRSVAGILASWGEAKRDRAPAMRNPILHTQLVNSVQHCSVWRNAPLGMLS